MSWAGRVYERSKAFNEDLGRNIIQDVVEKGGDLVPGYFPGSFSEIALKNRTTYNTVRKIWKQFFETGTCSTHYESHASHVFLPDGRPPYIYGDHIIMENAAIHHNRAGDGLGEWLVRTSC